MRFSAVLFSILASVAVAQRRWAIEQSRLATILFGITYVDEFNGFVQGAQDGSGPLILRSTNGGSSYQQVGHTGNTFFFMSGAAHSPINAAAGGVGLLAPGVQYTTTGTSFVDANIPVGFPPVSATQSGATVRGRAGFRDGAFGFTGMFGGSDGVAFTANGGTSWTLHTIPNLPAEVRNGAFPTLTTWYISGGTWPSKKKRGDLSGDIQVTEHVSVAVNNETLKSSVQITAEAGQAGEREDYVGFIYKTTNGGASFQQVFFNAGQYYFNGIDCIDVNTCLVVAEGRGGARLFGTRNGGISWDERLFVPGAAASLFDVKWVNGAEAWACGGVLDLSFTGRFYHSTDGGVNWVNNPFPGVYGTTLTFAPVGTSYHGHATALTIDGQSSTLVYK